ncbi:hypothetical protein [Bacillus cereus]|uniref:hypothetical protein n=1 Tax=Bacillus cereus TaxID=1396 RepID=UPI000BEE56C0|nr:hypothetical protein [Bacillus cereus]MEB8799666.1 hypothetical protein [Bacillus cereus]MEB8995557.1 hypothetical protein [Bacillus cereus]MEB9182052.1 hypothetical protein [Bacillus cereus]MEC3021091.1 hypothetical protein [Bacillus cereus]MEC3256515.1 hypothetical protein [Bacillus cereus]
MDIKELINIMCENLPDSLQEPVQEVVEIGGGAAPVIGSILNHFKFKKINKELNNLKGKIEKIAGKLDQSENEVFLKQEVFPIVLNRIMNDEQAEKLKIILNGFEYIIDNDILDFDKIFHYYDVLAEMRLSEIVHLTEKYVVPMEMMKNPEKMKLNIQLKMDYTEEEKEAEKEREDLKRYMDNKLFRLGILQYVKERVDEPFQDDYIQTGMPYQWQSPVPDKYEINIEKYKLSNFGKRFIKFFGEEE